MGRYLEWSLDVVKLILTKRLGWIEGLAIPADPTAPKEAELFEETMGKVSEWKQVHETLKDAAPNLPLDQRLTSPEKRAASKRIAHLLAANYTGRGGEE
jgi:hypothetical protein